MWFAAHGAHAPQGHAQQVYGQPENPLLPIGACHEILRHDGDDGDGGILQRLRVLGVAGQNEGEQGGAGDDDGAPHARKTWRHAACAYARLVVALRAAAPCVYAYELHGQVVERVQGGAAVVLRLVCHEGVEPDVDHPEQKIENAALGAEHNAHDPRYEDYESEYVECAGEDAVGRSGGYGAHDKNIIQRAERCPRNEFGHNVRDGFDRKINTLCRCLHATDDKFCLDAGD